MQKKEKMTTLFVIFMKSNAEKREKEKLSVNFLK
jgi:hypothetical protein